MDAHGFANNSVQIREFDAILEAERVAESAGIKSTINLVAKLFQNGRVAMEVVEDRSKGYSGGVTASPNHSPDLSGDVLDGPVNLGVRVIIDEANEFGEHVVTGLVIARPHVVEPLLNGDLGLLNDIEKANSTSAGGGKDHLGHKVEGLEPPGNVAYRASSTWHNIHEMTPIVVVDVVSHEAEPTRPAIENLADNIECVFAKPDSHIKRLVCGGEGFHFVIEDGDESIDTWLKFEDRGLRIERCNDPSSECVATLVCFFKIAATWRYFGVEALVKGRLDEDILWAVLDLSVVHLDHGC